MVFFIGISFNFFHSTHKVVITFMLSQGCYFLALALALRPNFLALALALELCGLGLECSGLGIKYKAIHYCLKYGTTDHTMYF